MSSMAAMGSNYAPRVRRWWVAAAVAGAAYGVFLIVAAAGLPAGSDLAGRFPGQPVAKSLMALLLAAAALWHPIRRERIGLIAALGFSASGDFLLAISWWKPSFIGGLGSFLLAHLCYLLVLAPLIRRRQLPAARLVAAVVVTVACLGLLAWFWPHLKEMTVPVTIYMLVIAAMVCAALLAALPTAWTAVGAVCFASSDAMIGTSVFIRGDELLAVPIWWAYAVAQLLITAGFFFARSAAGMSDAPAKPAP
ncbi:lysoplasmalogenase [Mycolicibacterium insubricum]